MRLSARLAVAAGLLLATIATASPSLAAKPRSATPPECDKACLEGFVDRYLAALVAKTPGQLPWASHVRFSENNVMLLVGDGLWGTITGRGPPVTELKFSDPQRGEAAFFGLVMQQQGVPSYIAIRLKIEDRKIAEVETNVYPMPPPRPGAPAGGPPGFTTVPPLEFRHFPEMFQALKPEERVPRGRLLDLANGYWSTMQLNDGTLFTQFDETCTRVEDGSITSGGLLPNGQPRPSCGEQFKTGLYRVDSAVRDRDFIVVDEEKGLVLSRAFIDHNGALTDYKTADGVSHVSNQRWPSTFSVLELFKIRNGKIFRIEVVHTNVPYHMPSVWRRDTDDHADPSAYSAWSGGAK